MTIDRILESLEEFVKRFRNPLQLIDFVLTNSSEAVELSLIRNDSGDILWLLVVSPESMKIMKASFNEKDYKEVFFSSEFEFFYKFIILFAPIYSKIGKGGLNSMLSKILSKNIENWFSYLQTMSNIIGEESLKILRIDPYTVKIGENTFIYDGNRATIQNPIDISINIDSLIELFSMCSVFFDLVLTLSDVEDFNFFLQNSIKDIEEAVEKQKILEELANPFDEPSAVPGSLLDIDTNINPDLLPGEDDDKDNDDEDDEDDEDTVSIEV